MPADWADLPEPPGHFANCLGNLAMKHTLILPAISFALLLSPSCKGESETESSGKGSKTTATALFTGSKASIPGPLAKLSFGMNEAAAKAAVPSLFEDKVSEYGGGARVATGDVNDMYTRISFKNGALDEVAFSVSKAAIADATKAWGEPTTVAWGIMKEPARVWFDHDAKIRAVGVDSTTGDDVTIEVSPFADYDQFASIGAGELALNPRSVLGKTPEELLKELPQWVKPKDTNSKSAKLTKKMMKGLDDDIKKAGIKLRTDAPALDAWLPRSLYSDSTTLISLHWNKKNRVRSMTLMLKANDLAKLDAETKAAFDKAYGAPKELAMTLGTAHVWYDEENGVRAVARLGGKFGTDISFAPYLQLKSMFGEPGTTWGFEKAPIIGATLDELAAAYGEELVRDERGGGYVRLPGTDYDGSSAETRVQLRLKGDGGKVESYYFSLEYKRHAGAKAEIEAMLAAKFGKPKAGKRESVYNKKNPSVTVRDSDITKQFTVTVK